MKHRLLRVNEIVKRELSTIITRDMKFENVLVTVNTVDVTPISAELRLGSVEETRVAAACEDGNHGNDSDHKWPKDLAAILPAKAQ